MESNSNYTNQIEDLIQQCKKDPKLYFEIMNLIFTNKFDILEEKIRATLPSFTKNKFHQNFNFNRAKILEKIKHENDPIKKSLSSIYGAFLGDAMGANCEFSQPNKSNCKNIFKGHTNQFGNCVGSVTDDSEMAMSMAYGIMDNLKNGNISTENNYFYYGLWFNSAPADIGNATRTALSPFKRVSDMNYIKEHWSYIFCHFKDQNSESKANGFLMRFSPFLSWFYFMNINDIRNAYHDKRIADMNLLLNLFNKAKEEARKDNICTHPHQELNSVSAFYTIIGIFAIHGLDNNEICSILYSLIQEKLKENNSYDKQVASLIFSYIEKYNPQKGKKDAWKIFTSKEDNVFDRMGFYTHALKLTIFYLLNLHIYQKKNGNNTYRKIMEEINNFGGDTDTNAAIVGGIIGTLIGIDHIPDNDFNTMFMANVDQRKVFSPFLMYLYVRQLAIFPEKKEKIDEYLFLRMFLYLSCDNLGNNGALIEQFLNYN